MEWIRHRCKVSIRFRDTDSYGIVHHSNFFCYFEEARYDFSKKILNFQEDMMDGRCVKFPVIEAYCNYRHAVKYTGEDLYVEVLFRVVNDSKIEFRYKLTNDSGLKVYAKGNTVHAFVDNEKLCLVIPEWFKNRITNLDLLMKGES